MSKIITPNLIEKLYQDEIINEATRRAGLTYLKGPRPWGRWIERLCLGLGTSLILAAIMFFFAYNWEDLGKWFQFMLIEAAILLCLIGSVLPLKAYSINQTLALAASFLVGVLLALIGQTYQTGADAWQLFAVWAAVIVPWVILSKFAPQWGLWLIVTNLALGLWMDQTLSLNRAEEIFIPAAHAALNGTMLLALLYARPFFNWLQNPWTLRIMSTALILILCILSIQCIFQKEWSILLLAIAAMAAVSQLLLFFYSRYRWHDFIIHALLIIALAIEAEALIMKFISSYTRWGTGGIFTGSILTLIMFTALISYLYKAHQTMEASDDH